MLIGDEAMGRGGETETMQGLVSFANPHCLEGVTLLGAGVRKLHKETFWQRANGHVTARAGQRLSPDSFQRSGCGVLLQRQADC